MESPIIPKRERFITRFEHLYPEFEVSFDVKILEEESSNWKSLFRLSTNSIKSDRNRYSFRSKGFQNDATRRFLEIINIVIVVPKYPAFSTEHFIIEQKIVICQHLLLGHVSIGKSQNSCDYRK